MESKMSDLDEIIRDVKSERQRTLVQLRVDSRLLGILDDYARENKITRAAGAKELIAIGYKSVEIAKRQRQAAEDRSEEPPAAAHALNDQENQKQTI